MTGCKRGLHDSGRKRDEEEKGNHTIHPQTPKTPYSLRRRAGISVLSSADNTAAKILSPTTKYHSRPIVHQSHTLQTPFCNAFIRQYSNPIAYEQGISIDSNALHHSTSKCRPDPETGSSFRRSPIAYSHIMFQLISFFFAMTNTS